MVELGVALIGFAENLSEYSRLHLVEIRDFLAGGMGAGDDTTWVSLCAQAIPLFPKITTCVLHQDLQENWGNRLYHLPTGDMAGDEVNGIFRWAMKSDDRIAKFVTLVLSDEYRYMRHIDFLFVFHLRRCQRFWTGSYILPEQRHKHTIEVSGSSRALFSWFDDSMTGRVFCQSWPATGVFRQG